MRVRSPFRPGSSEFPHDNPAINHGILWIGTSLCAIAPEPVAEAAPEPVAEAAPEPVVEAAPEPVAEAAPEPVVQAAPEPVVEAAPGPVVEKKRSRRRHASPPPPPPEPVAVDLAQIAEAALEQPAEEPPPGAHDVAVGTDSPPEPLPTMVEGLAALSSDVPDLPLSEPAIQAALETLPAPAKPAAFTMFVDAVVDVTRERGGDQAAAQVAVLLDGDVPDVGDETAALLIDGQILEPETRRPTESFLRLAQAWKSALSSDGSDLAGCGETTLDNWTADLVSRVLHAPSMASAIRRDLRRHGIAAFGMLE